MGAICQLPLPTQRRSSTNRAAPCSLLALRIRGHPAGWPLRGLPAYKRSPPGVPLPRARAPWRALRAFLCRAPSPSQARAIAPGQGKRKQSRRIKLRARRSSGVAGRCRKAAKIEVKSSGRQRPPPPALSAALPRAAGQSLRAFLYRPLPPAPRPRARGAPEPASIKFRVAPSAPAVNDVPLSARGKRPPSGCSRAGRH